MTRPAVLFVCLGNICRSPLAEAAFRAAAHAAAIDVVTDSAGTGDWHVGRPPDPRAQAEALRHGIDISRYRARQVSPADFTAFTHIFALDHRNLADLRHIAPAAHDANVSLLLDIIPGLAGESVADPYYGGSEGFAETWRQVSEAARVLVTLLRQGTF